MAKTVTSPLRRLLLCALAVLMVIPGWDSVDGPEPVAATPASGHPPTSGCNTESNDLSRSLGVSPGTLCWDLSPSAQGSAVVSGTLSGTNPATMSIIPAGAPCHHLGFGPGCLVRIGRPPSSNYSSPGTREGWALNQYQCLIRPRDGGAVYLDLCGPLGASGDPLDPVMDTCGYAQSQTWYRPDEPSWPDIAPRYYDCTFEPTDDIVNLRGETWLIATVSMGHAADPNFENQRDRRIEAAVPLDGALRPLARFDVEPISAGSLTVRTTNRTSIEPGHNASYRWNFGDGTTSTDRSPHHAYSRAGTYTVTLRVEDLSVPSTAVETARIHQVTQTVTVVGDDDDEDDDDETPLPTAACTVYDSPSAAGRFDFDATASTGEALTYRWDFGDGASGTGFLDSHTYDRPGTFTSSVTVTDNNARTATAACPPVEVKAPELGIAFSYPGRDSLPDGSPNMAFALEDEIVVRVHLRAGDGVGALTDVEFVGDVLRSTPTTAWDIDLDGIVEVDDRPDDGEEEDVPLTLEPGDEVAFDVPAEAVQPGAFSFVSSVVAVDAADRFVGPVEVDRGGRIGELEVEVIVEPETVELEEGDDEDGPVPEPVTVTVKVTNPFDAEVTDVVVEPNHPQLMTDTQPPLGYKAFTYMVGDPDDPDAEPTQGQPGEVELDDLGPGETVTHVFEGMALDRGDVRLRVQARGSYDRRTVAGVADGDLQVATDIQFVFSAEIDSTSHSSTSGEPWVLGGSEWRISGSFENRTHDETYEVVMIPAREANAGVGIPRELMDPAIADHDCAIGVAKQVEPGETIEWSAPVTTSPTGGTRSVVRYAPQVYVIDEDGSRTPLEDEHVLVVAGSDEHLMRVDTRDHRPVRPGAGELLWVFGESAIETFEESFIGMVAFGADLLALGLQPWEWPAAYQQSVHRMVEYVDTIYENLSPGDQRRWKNSVVSAVLLSTGMALTDANDLVNAMVEESFTELNHAWVTGDAATTAEWFGRQVGANPDVALGPMVKAFSTCKLISSRMPWARNALVAKEAAIEAELVALGGNVTAANIPTGARVTRELRRKIWGIDDAMHAKVQAFVDEFGITIGVRRRGPGSIAKIEAGTHNPKPFHNKAKNASATDVDWLGFVDDLDTAAIKQPPPVTELRQALAGAPPDVRAQVLARHRTRTKEWYGKAPTDPGTPAYEAWLENGTGADFTKSERYKWAQFSVPVDRGGGIPVPRHGAPLDYRTNVSAGRSLPSDDALYVRAPARVRTVTAPDGRPQMILETDRGSGFKPDTGDMDPLVVTKADLTALPESRRIAFYHQAHELGFEHVESASWNNPAGRNAYLNEHAIAGPGRAQGEAMHQWMPNSTPRATRFDPQRSWHDPRDELNAARFFLHGTDVYLKVADPGSGAGYVIDDSDDYAAYTSPKTTIILDPACVEGAGCTVTFDRSSDAVVFTTSEEARPLAWTPDGGWEPYSIPADGEVLVLPQSVITDEAEPGDSRIEIASADDLDLDPGTDTWFAVGDEIVIDPGGPNEEFAIIGGFGSLLVTEPLAHAHAPGTMVSVVVPHGDPNNPRDPNGPWGDDNASGGGSETATDRSDDRASVVGDDTTPTATGRPLGTANTERPTRHGPLAHTGSGVVAPTAAGLFAILAGAVLRRHHRRRRRTRQSLLR